MNLLKIFLLLFIVSQASFSETIETCDGGFQIYYDDLEGEGDSNGFFDTTSSLTVCENNQPCSKGKQRRETFCAVLDYISTIIDIGSKVPKIYARKSQGDGDGPIAAVSLPIGITETTFWGGPLYYYLKEGIDLTQGPLGGFYAIHTDAWITVDFGPKANGVVTIHNDYKLPSSTSEIDLFTVLLHEMTHALGFTDGMNINGEPVFSGTGFDAYGLLALNMVKSNGQPFIDPNTLELTGPISMITTPGSLNYQVSPSTNYTIYTPDTYVGASSLKHFDNEIDGTIYVMKPSLTQSEPDIREFTSAEIQFFCKVGLPIFTPLDCKNISNSFPPTGQADIPNNSTAYHQTVRSGDSICINVLENDIDLNGDTITIHPDYISILDGGGLDSSISINSSQELCYQSPSNFQGQAFLEYRPFDGGLIGNATNVKVNVLPKSCEGICSLVCNGSFEKYQEIILSTEPTIIYQNTIAGNQQNLCPSPNIDGWCTEFGAENNKVSIYSKDPNFNGSTSYLIPNAISVVNNQNPVDTTVFQQDPLLDNKRYVSIRASGISSTGVIEQFLIQPLKKDQSFKLELDLYALKRDIEDHSMAFVQVRGIGSNGDLTFTQDLTLSVPTDYSWHHFEENISVNEDTLKIEFQIINNELPLIRALIDNVYIKPIDVNNGFVKPVLSISAPILNVGETVSFQVGACAIDSNISQATVNFQLPPQFQLISTGMDNYPEHTFTNLTLGNCQYETVIAQVISPFMAIDNKMTICNSIADSSQSYECLGNEPNSFNSCVSTFMPIIDISVDKKFISSNIENVGDYADFEILISNPSKIEASNIQIKENIPAGFQVQNVQDVTNHPNYQPDFSFNYQTNTLTLVSLPKETIARFKVRLKLAHIGRACRDIARNQIVLTHIDQQDSNYENDMSEVDFPISACKVDLEITKRIISKPPYKLGQTINYLLNVKNLKANDALNLEIEDIIPTDLELLQVFPINNTPASFEVVGSIIKIANLPLGISADFIMKFKISPEPSKNLCKEGVVNQANVTISPQIEIQGSNNQASSNAFTVAPEDCIPGFSPETDRDIEKVIKRKKDRDRNQVKPYLYKNKEVYNVFKGWDLRKVNHLER